MKYVRTKDDEIYNTRELVKCEDKRFPNGWFTKNGVPLIAIKQADTIEELCDNCVYRAKCSTHIEPYVVSKGQFNYFRNFRQFGGNHNDRVEYDYVVGAIWTDKGLIYVAIMNKKGELELI